MKKNYLLALLIVMFSFGIKAQQHLSWSKVTGSPTSKDPSITSYNNALSFENIDQVEKEFYLQKSRNQKTGAWILLGGGTVLIGGAYLFGNSSNATFDAAATSVVVAGVGVLAAFGSIPLFIASRKNKVKARLSINLNRSPATGKQVRSIGVNIPIGK